MSAGAGPGALRTVVTLAALTVRETARRRVMRSLAVLTLVLLALSAWGFSRLAVLELDGEAVTTGEGRLTASIILNLLMFGLSLVAALGTTFLAGPTVAGEVESGVALAVLARPVRRWAVLVGKWCGLVVFGGGYVVLAGLALVVVLRLTLGFWPPQPLVGLALMAAQTTVLMTLGLMLSTVISPMASGIVAVGLFGTTWIAGVIGGLGAAFGNEQIAQVGTVSRVLLPTDGLWRGAMNAFQDPTALLTMAGDDVAGGFPFLGPAPLTWAYLAWCVVWVALVLSVAALAFQRRDV